jgi:hypothetical protein
VSKPNSDRRQAFRLIVVLTALTVVIGLACYVPTGPRKKYQDSRKRVAQTRTQLDLAKTAKADEEKRLRNQDALVAQLKARDANFSLWSHLNRVLTETTLKDRANLQEVKPHAKDEAIGEAVTLVQLKLRGVKLAELVEMLHRAYSGSNLVVLYKLDTLKPAQDQKGLDCDITFLSPKPGAAKAA